MVRFQTFKIFFLGADGGKAISITNERCTFLEALALSGDLNLFTNRDKIAVMREIDGRMVTRYLDPRSSKVFNDPFFMLQQNDFIITRNRNYRNFVDSFNQWNPFITLFSSAISVASLVMMFTPKKPIFPFSRKKMPTHSRVRTYTILSYEISTGSHFSL